MHAAGPIAIASIQVVSTANSIHRGWSSVKRASPTHGERWLAQINYDALMTHHTTENCNGKSISDTGPSINSCNVNTCVTGLATAWLISLWTKWLPFWQAAFSNIFLWMKTFVFWLIFHWSLFLRVQSTIFQHWFRWWLGAGQATSHYLDLWWLVNWRIYASLGLNELINSLWPCDTIWWQRSVSTMTQVMAWCLTAPSHHLTQCSLIINKVQW